MATKYKVDFAKADVEYGKVYSFTPWLDQSYTNGVEVATLLAFKGNGATDAKEGKVTTTYEVADASELKKAVGVVWRDSLKPVGVRDDAYTAVQNYNQNIYMPYGDQEEKGLVPIKEFAIQVMDDDKEYFFNTVDTALTGTIEVAGGALDTVVGTGTAFDTELEVGDLIKVGNEKREVTVIGSATSVTVLADFSGAITAGATAYQASDLDRSIFLGEDGIITKTAPTSGLVQKVGKVVNGNKVLCNLNLDDGTVV